MKYRIQLRSSYPPYPEMASRNYWWAVVIVRGNGAVRWQTEMYKTKRAALAAATDLADALGVEVEIR